MPRRLWRAAAIMNEGMLRIMAFDVAKLPAQAGRVFVVTGANSGVGYWDTRMLAAKGARIVMACRNVTKGAEAKAEIEAAVPDAQLEVMALDLGDLSSVRRFADDFRARYDHLDVLINNAGVMWVPKGTTADGFETHFGTNVLGHVLLTSLLLDLMPDSSDSRVVTVSSSAHKGVAFNFDDVAWEKSYSKVRAYRSSKLANLLFALELQRRLDAAGSKVLSVAAHPGMSINTGLVQSEWLKRVISIIAAPLDNSPDNAALPTVLAAIGPDVRGGQFFGPTGLGELKGDPGLSTPSNQARDVVAARKLWDIAEKLTGATWKI